jgi:hypothetical protein
VPRNWSKILFRFPRLVELSEDEEEVPKKLPSPLVSAYHRGILGG